MKYLTQKAFWKKFFRFFSVGVSVLFILAFASTVSFAEISQRGPKLALAQQVGECDNGYEYLGSHIGWQWTGCTSGGSQAPSQVPSQVPSQLPPKQHEPHCPNYLEPAYPQCGKDIISAGTTVNDAGQSINPTSVYLVTRYTNSCNRGEVRGYAVSGSQKDNAPECGYVTPAQPIQPASAPQPVYQPQPVPQPQPVAQPVAPICVPQNVSMSVNPNPAQINQQINLSVSGSEGSTWIDDKIVDQYGNTVYQGGFWGSKTVGPLNPGNYTWTHYYRNTAPNNFNITSDLCQKSVTLSVFSPAPTPTPMPTPTPVPTPAPRGAVELKCPDGTVQTLEGNTIVCIQNINNVSNVNNINNQNNQSQSQSQVVNVPPAQVITVPQNVQTVQREVLVPATTTVAPKVTYVAATEAQALPKTGLPLAGVALGGLLPIGLKLRKIGKGKDIISANSLWEERQFKI